LPDEPLSRDEWDQIEARVRRKVPVRDDFVSIPFPRVAATTDRATVAAVERYQREAAITDARLTRAVTLQLKATALSDVCERLKADSGIYLRAGPSVADEKVTVYCEKQPLRDVMRQLSRPFGYTWLRTGLPSPSGGKAAGGEQSPPLPAGEGAGGRGYRYELVQDLRSQLLEEELRNRDRNAAVLALDSEMERYRGYRDLSPDEVLARARTAPPGEKALLENLSKYGWGPIQMYFRLSPQDLAALRAGEELTFSADPQPGEQPLPPEVARGVLQSLRDWRVGNRDGRLKVGNEQEIPDGLPLLSVPETQARVTLRIDPSELGQFLLDGGSGVKISSLGQSSTPTTSVALAVGTSPAARDPGRGTAGARLAGDSTLRPRLSVQPQHSCEGVGRQAQGVRDGTPPPSARRPPPDKVTSADVLEALHRATRLPIVADYYTRLYPRSAVSVNKEPLLDVLNQLSGAMRLRWNKEGPWLQFRSVSYYDDRLKEVPNRFLACWAASRRQHGFLTLNDLIEIARLSDVQLDSKLVAEGIRECFGLLEWDLARSGEFRPHLRYLGELTPAQRQEALTARGLRFTRLSLAQQQQFMSRLGTHIRSLEQLASTLLRVEYTQPGGFRWEGPDGPTVSPVLAPTREAALQAARRIDPQADAAQILPSERAVTVLYTWGNPDLGGGLLAIRATPHYTRHRSDSYQARLPEGQIRNR
jgi:hypothetical protein